MKKEDYVAKFYPPALKVQEETGFSAIVNLAQGAIESGWGDICPGNMLFSIQDINDNNGKKQLSITIEFSRNANADFPNIISTTPVIRNGQKWFKYKIKDYFIKFNTFEECFRSHSEFFTKDERYLKAVEVRDNPNRLIEEIAKAGYSHDPNYAATLKSIAHGINKIIINNERT